MPDSEYQPSSGEEQRGAQNFRSGSSGKRKQVAAPRKGFPKEQSQRDMKKLEKQERHESNCPDRPSRRQDDSCQPLKIFGVLATSKL